MIVKTEIEWWNSLKIKLADSREMMERVEKMSKAERESIDERYQRGDKATRDQLEEIRQIIAVFRSHGLEKED